MQEKYLKQKKILTIIVNSTILQISVNQFTKHGICRGQKRLLEDVVN